MKIIQTLPSKANEQPPKGLEDQVGYDENKPEVIHITDDKPKGDPAARVHQVETDRRFGGKDQGTTRLQHLW